MLSNKVYDVLKWLCIFVLPALASLVKVVFSIWHIPYGDEISATIVALNAFLGAVLGLSNTVYHTLKQDESGEGNDIYYGDE